MTMIFINMPIPPATSAEFYDINAALLNIVMKEQFSGSPNADPTMHLNTFVELCDMQKKKDMDKDVIKLKLFRCSLRYKLKLGFHLYLVIVLEHEINVKMLSLPSIFLLLRSSPLGIKL